MNERIKMIRKKKVLSQDSFGKRLGITKSSVSLIESGKNNPSEQTVKLICKEFEVNEVWLRTGDGGDENMFVRINAEDKYSRSLSKLANSENKFVRNAVIFLADAEPEKLDVIFEFMRSCLEID